MLIKKMRCIDIGLPAGSHGKVGEGQVIKDLNNDLFVLY